LACIGGHARAPTKSCKSGVYDSGRTSYLSCSCVPRSSGRIHCGLLGILHARIQRALASVPPPVAVVLWLGTASSNSFGDPTDCGLRNLVRSLHGE
jgi:hypothetical protein